MKKKFINLLLVLTLLVTLGGVFATPALAAPRTLYWFGDGGNWSDTAHWSLASGGPVGGELVPDSDDTIIFDAASFSIGGQTVTVDAVANCLDMDWTGVTDSPTLAGANLLYIYGSMTIESMNWNFATALFWAGVGVHTITTNGITITTGGDLIYKSGIGTYTLQDTLTTGTGIALTLGTLDTNGETVTVANQFSSTGAGVKTLTLGASVINTVNWYYTGTNLTLTANTATISVTGTGTVTLGAADYNGASFNLNGTAHAVSGSPTGIANLNTNFAIAQAFTITDGSNITVDDAALSGSAGFLHTLTGSGVAGWTITKAGGSYILCDYLDLSYSTGAPVETWGYGFNSTIGVDVIDWGVPIFYINVDGVEEDAIWAGGGVSVPDNANDWYYCTNGSMPYMEYTRITVGGTLQQYIAWEYDTIFTDLSGQGHDATPSFAVDSSDPDITASLISYGPIEEADAPAYTIGAPPDFITTAPNLTSDFSDTISPTIPGAEVITEAAASSSTPVQLPWVMISAFSIMAMSMLATYLTTRMGSGNSVFIKIAIILIGMGFMRGVGVYDFWMLIYFIIPAIAVAWASRPQESLG